MCAIRLQRSRSDAAKEDEAGVTSQRSEILRHPAHHSDRRADHRLHCDGGHDCCLKDDKESEPTASLYYTAYTRTGTGDSAVRPVTFIYNGGPGGSSAPQHMGAVRGRSA